MAPLAAQSFEEVWLMDDAPPLHTASCLLSLPWHAWFYGR